MTYSFDGKIQGNDDFGLQEPLLKRSALLAATTEATLTIPDSQSPNFRGSDAFLAVIKYGAGSDVFVSVNGQAEVPIAPVGAALNATTSQLNPPALKVKSGDVMSFITRDANTDLTVTLYPF